MSTRVRYIMKFGGSWYCGSQIKATLQQYEVPVETFAQVKAVAAKIGATLWALREPRRISRKRSQYKTACRNLGLGKARFKKSTFHELVIPQLAIPQVNLNLQQVVGGLQYHVHNGGGPAQPVGLAAGYQAAVGFEPDPEPPDF